MLYVIGLGLGDEKDITLRGLEAIEKCSRVYMEAYTSLLSFGLTSNGLSTLEKVYGNQIIIADREMVEEKADDMLSDAQVSDVAILVVGDPFGATTHSDLVVRAKKLGVDVKVVHNASVMNAIGVCGLQLYRYGETVSIPFFTDTWRPDSFYEKIKRNRSLGLHTHWLLDIRVKERTLESLCRGKKVYEPPRFMTTNTAIEQLLEVDQNKCPFSPLVETFLLSEAIWKNCHFKDKQLIPLYSEDSTCVGLARVMKQLVTIEEMLEFYPTDGNSKET